MSPLASSSEVSDLQKNESRRPPEMSEELKQAFDECFEETGLTRPEKGERPSLEDREIMDECLAEKGFDKPKFKERKISEE